MDTVPKRPRWAAHEARQRAPSTRHASFIVEHPARILGHLCGKRLSGRCRAWGEAMSCPIIEGRGAWCGGCELRGQPVTALAMVAAVCALPYAADQRGAGLRAGLSRRERAAASWLRPRRGHAGRKPKRQRPIERFDFEGAFVRGSEAWNYAASDSDVACASVAT